MEQAINKKQEEKEQSLYCGIGNFKFKSFTVQNNIGSINKLYFGLSLSLSYTPYIYKNEVDGKYYLAAYCFRINQEKENNIKNIYYPTSFLNLIFYYNNMIFFIKSNNELSLYKFENNKCINYIFSPQYLAKNEKPKKNITKNSINKIITEENKIKEISDKLAKIENSSLKSTYEILCDILKNNLNEELMVKSKEMHSRIGYFIKIDELEFTCELKKDLKEIDSIGHLREPINVINEEIPFTKGIEKLIKYIELKNAKDKSAEGYIKNDFKCPILYKNFKEEIIPPNKAILVEIKEIKGGLAIEDIAEQIDNRIKFINNCLFNEGEKPEYFIGIINV